MSAKYKASAINSLAELDRLGVSYEPAGDDEIKLRCPAHDDSTPSLGLNVRKNLFKCFGCGASGDIVTLLSLLTGVSRATMLSHLGEKYELTERKTIAPEVVERHHAAIWQAGPLLVALRERGVTDDMIREARLGYHDGRISIPVYDVDGAVVNIRRYLPGAPSSEKMRNVVGFGRPRLYQIDQAKNDRVWVCGGEIKALVVGHLLRQHGVGAVAGTAGETFWDPAWSAALKDRDVWVCMDIDDVGRAATGVVAGMLVGIAKTVRVVSLPLSEGSYPHGDVNDYVGKEGAGAEELLALMREAPEYQPPLVGEDRSKPLGRKECSLADSLRPDSVGWVLDVDAVVSAMDTTPYLVPRMIGVSCSRDQRGCSSCPVFPLQPSPDKAHVEMEVSSQSSSVLELAGCSKSGLRNAIRHALGIPKCAVANFSVRSHMSIIDVRLSPQIGIGSEGSSSSVPAMCVDVGVELSAPYVLTGMVFPHPKNQQATLVMTEARSTRDSLDSFAPTDEQLRELEVFRPSAWTDDTLAAKLDEIYDDLEHNVTHVFRRRHMHIVIDLAFHSALRMMVDGHDVNGWINALILGDSAQGKTEATTRMMRHYGAGERVDCKNATVAGLLGGLQQIGTRWFVSWGIIPMHDRRIVILEELKGASTDIIGRLADMRSSGIAEIPKIERRRAMARTRLVMVSNPRSPRPMSAFGFGVEAIAELVGSPEDVRRFDVAVILAAGEVQPDTIDEERARTVEHAATSTLCRRLVGWAWTRTQDQIVVEDDARVELRAAADAMCADFVEEIPLVDVGTTRHKIARLSVALASRTFSTDDGSRVVVRTCHVRRVAKLLREEYSSAAFGYFDFSRIRRESEVVTNPKAVAAYIDSTKHPSTLVDYMLHRDDVTLQDVQDVCEVDRDTAQGVLSFLVRHRTLRRDDRVYRKTSDFIALLKGMQANGLDHESDRRSEDEF